MSRNRKNNHYHYAEKFTDRRRSAKSALLLPRRAVFFAVLVLLAFGVICATFSTDDPAAVSSDAHRSDGGIMVSVRSNKSAQDIALTGAKVDYAATGYYVTNGKLLSIDDNTAKFTDTYGSNVYLVERTSNKLYFYKFNRIGNSYYYALNAAGRSDLSDGCMIVFLGKNVSNGSTWDNNWDDFVAWGPSNSSFELLKYIYCGLQDIGGDTRFTLPATGNATTASGTPEAVFDNGIDVQLQYKVGSGSYTNASDTWSPGTTSVTLSTWNSSYNGGSSSTENFTKSGHIDRAARNSNLVFSSTASSGFTFDDYYNNSASAASTSNPYTVSNTYSANANHTFYARYHANYYTISYNLTGGVNGAGADWADGYTSYPEDRYYTQEKTLPVAANVQATGRTFQGWYDNPSCTGTALTKIAANTASNVTLYAKWKWDTYTITYAKGDSSYSTGGKVGGYVAPGTKTYGVDYTIANYGFTRDGFTQVGWATSANATVAAYEEGDTYDVDAVLTLYPVWELNDPTATITGGSMVAGSSAGVDLLSVSPGPAIPENPKDTTQSIVYTVTAAHGGTYTITNSSGGAFTRTDAVFKSSVPDTYTVSVTVTNTSTYGVTNTSSQASVTSASVTIYVTPVAPLDSDLTLVINGSGLSNPTSAGTDLDPFMILIGSDYDFTATMATNVISGYNYEWSFASDFATTFATANPLTFNDNSPTRGKSTDSGYAMTHAAAESSNTSLTIYCRAEKNGQYSTVAEKTIVYFIQPLVENFTFVPFQLIYNINDSAVSLSAQYNMSNAANYTTNLKFSHDNNDFSENAATVSNSFMTTFTEVIKKYLYPSGPKYFFMNIANAVNLASSDSLTAHTTVGTRDSDSARPLYFYNKTSMNFSPYQVMCYWPDEDLDGGFGYQIAQDMYVTSETNKGKYYRVNLPSNATEVYFALVAKGEGKQYHYYGTPTVSDGVLSFTAPIYVGWTEKITLAAGVRVVETDSSYTTSTQGTATVYAFNNCVTSGYKSPPTS